MTWGFAMTVAQAALHLARELVSHFSSVVGAQVWTKLLMPRADLWTSCLSLSKAYAEFQVDAGLLHTSCG